LGDLLVEGVDARLRRPDVGAGRTEQAKKVCFIQSQIAQVIDGEPMRECARKR
jgi:hypothetical protein